MKSKLQGIIPPIVTPLLGHDQLDYEGIEKLVNHLIVGGVHGIFVLGTTGEFASLSEKLKLEMVTAVCQCVNQRVPVLVGITHTSLEQTWLLARHAEAQGATAVVLSTPYYFSLSQPELCDYISMALSGLSLPVYLYNIPSCTKVPIEIETIKRFLDSTQIAGVKDSSGNMAYYHELLHVSRQTDWSVLMGPEELLAESVLLGGHGGVAGGANLFPRLFVSIYESAVANDVARVRALQEYLSGISSTLYRTGAYGSSFIKSVKCALSVLGICSDEMAAPFQKFGYSHREKVAEQLGALSLTLTGIQNNNF